MTNRKVNFLFIYVIIFLANPCITKAQEDFTITGNKLIIRHLNGSSIPKINSKIKGKPIVILEKTITQEDFNNIPNLPWIEVLIVARGNETLSSLNPISKLKNLKEIEALGLKSSRKNPIDLGPLAKNINLESICLLGTKVTNTKSLSTLKNLRSIDLNGSCVDSIDFLKNTPKVERLILNGKEHKFKDYSPLESLSKLKEVNLHANPQMNDKTMKSFSNLISLEKLYIIEGVKLTNLSFLKNFRNLKILNAGDCKKLKDISALSDKTELEFLNLYNTSIVDFSPLIGKPKLKNLNLGITSFSDPTILEDSKNIETLYLENSKVQDISFIAGLEKLKKLVFIRNIPKKPVKKNTANLSPTQKEEQKTSKFSEIPKELQGSWIVNIDTTVAKFKASPKFKPEDEVGLKMMRSFLKNAGLKITSNLVVLRTGSEEKIHELEFISKNGGKTIMEFSENGEKTNFSATITKEGDLCLHKENDNEFGNILWKKGNQKDKSELSVAKMLVDIMQSALESGMASIKTVPPKEKEAPPNFEFKYGRLQIQHLQDESGKDLKDFLLGRTEIELGENFTQEDFEKLSSQTWIKDLRLGFNNKNITSFGPLSQFTSLIEFKSSSLKNPENKPYNLAPFANLHNIEKLNFYATKVTNTDALSGLTNLKEISFYMSGIDSLSFLNGTPQVEVLNLYGFSHTFKDYIPILSLPNLKELDIYMNPQATDELLAPLSGLTNLEKIHLANDKKVSTLSFLSNCKELREVKANWCKNLKDISALSDKANLEVLELVDTLVADFSILKGKTKLKILYVSGTSFADLSLLNESTSLQRLDLLKTQITDISPLSNFKNLKNLSVSKNIPDEQIEAIKKALPRCRVHKSMHQ